MITIKTINKILTSNNKEIAYEILKPESIIEQFMGLRHIQLEDWQAMVWSFRFNQVQIFDSLSCKYPIGYIACNGNNRVTMKGVLIPNRFKMVTCKYWIEVLPEIVRGVGIGDYVNTEIFI